MEEEAMGGGSGDDGETILIIDSTKYLGYWGCESVDRLIIHFSTRTVRISIRPTIEILKYILACKYTLNDILKNQINIDCICHHILCNENSVTVIDIVNSNLSICNGYYGEKIT